MSKLIEMEELTSLHISLPAIEITNEAIDERIEMVLRDKSIKAASDEAIEIGDNIYMSFTGKTVDGEDFKGSHGNNLAGEVGTEDLIKEFNEALPGHKVGDQLEITVHTEADFHMTEVADKTLIFDVHINKVMKDVLPTLDNFFVQSLELAGITTVDKFKDFAKKALAVDKFKENEVMARNRLIKMVVDKGVYEIDEASIDEESKRLVHLFNEKLLYQGLILEDYLSNKGMDKKDLADSYHEEAKGQIKIRLVFEYLEKEFSIKLTDEDIEKEVQALKEEHDVELTDLIRMSPKHKEKFISDVVRRRIVEELMERTTIDYVAAD